MILPVPEQQAVMEKWQESLREKVKDYKGITPDEYVTNSMEYLELDFKDTLNPGGLYYIFWPYKNKGALLRLKPDGSIPDDYSLRFCAIMAFGNCRGYDVEVESIEGENGENVVNITSRC